MWSNGINPIMGIIQECEDHFDSKNFSLIRAPINHYAATKGIPLKDAKTREYKPSFPAGWIPHLRLSIQEVPA